jgi:hypothetical protein
VHVESSRVIYSNHFCSFVSLHATIRYECPQDAILVVNVSSHTLKTILSGVLPQTIHSLSVCMIRIVTLLSKGIIAHYKNNRPFLQLHVALVTIWYAMYPLPPRPSHESSRSICMTRMLTLLSKVSSHKIKKILCDALFRSARGIIAGRLQ